MKRLLLIIMLLLIPSLCFAQAGIGRLPTTTIASLPDTSTEVLVDLSTVERPIKQLQIKCRTSVAIRMGFTAGDTTSNYTTIPADQTYFDNDLNFRGIIYLKSGSGAVTAEVMYWQ